jgi:hypothetical protein
MRQLCSGNKQLSHHFTYRPKMDKLLVGVYSSPPISLFLLLGDHPSGIPPPFGQTTIPRQWDWLILIRSDLLYPRSTPSERPLPQRHHYHDRGPRLKNEKFLITSGQAI